MIREPARTKKSVLLAGDGNQHHRSGAHPGHPRELARRIHQQCRPGGVIHRTIIDAVPVHWAANADVIEMRREHHVLVTQPRIAPRQHADDVLRFDLPLRELRR